MFRTFSRSWSAFRRAGAGDRLVLLETLAWLAAARLVVRVVPFRILSRRLMRRLPAPALADLPGPGELRRLGWALNAVGARVPWRSKCLERAIAGKIFLRVRGHPSTIFLGVSRGEAGQGIEAHAWLRCGGIPVVGEEAPGRDWSVVASFPDQSAPDQTLPVPRESGGAAPAPVVFPARHR